MLKILSYRKDRDGSERKREDGTSTSIQRQIYDHKKDPQQLPRLALIQQFTFKYDLLPHL